MTESQLVVSHVSKRFGGVVAADDLSTTIDGGTCTAIIGPNGAGKSTLLNMVCNLVLPDAGEILWRGQPLVGRSFRDVCGQGIQRMFQELRLFSSLTASENVAAGLLRERQGLGGLHWRSGGADRDHRVGEMLAALGLESVGRRRITDLSYAEQKLVALGRALVGRPGLLLLDEPASGLDKKSLDVVLRVLAEARERGSGILIVEHNLEIVGQMATRGLLLEEGRIVADGPPADVFRDSSFGRVFFSLRENPRAASTVPGEG